MAPDHDPDAVQTLNDPSPASARSSRRAVVSAGMYAAVLAAFARRASAQGVSAGPQVNLRPTPAGELRFLVDRITNGWNASAWARAQQLGYSAYLEEQLAYTTIPENATLTAQLANLTTLNMSSKQLYDDYFAPNAPLPQSVPIIELETAVILRGALSTRQLFERMVEFWTDHFNVDHGDGAVRWLKTTEDRAVIRVHALGNFHDLLLADARSAAMLYYLDNNRNFASAPNENYAREVMELHSLGVGNYSETDVQEVARCLTGWQYWPTSSAIHGDFRFNAAQHDNGSKTVLGTFIPAGGGITDGETVMNILATHPATAQFISRKLIRWLLAYNPPQSVVDQVAAVFTSSNGDIKSLVRAILAPQTVNQIASGARTKLKRPFHLACSVLRATNPTINDLRSHRTELTNMGHRPMAWPAPNGYPEAAEVWGQSVLPRWNYLSRYFGGSIPGITLNLGALFGNTPKSQLAARANDVLFGGNIAAEDVAQVQAYADAAPVLNDLLRREVLALTTQSPSFQYI
jgi:uncharacterized protein (DUF1800 family)